MENSNCPVDASLDLNISSFHHTDKSQKRDSEEEFSSPEKNPAKEKKETGALVEELNRVCTENKRLTRMLTIVCENYCALQAHLNGLLKVKGSESELASTSKKRKAEESEDVYGNTVVERSSSERPKEGTRAKISRVYIRADASDSNPVVKDGYQWRKYGQKVTRDNPSPRAYFRCSFAPSCPVKKKVQRSPEDPSVVVATYEGEHNHANPSESNHVSFGPTRGPTTIFLKTSDNPSLNLDLLQPETCNIDEARNSMKEHQGPFLQQVLVQQMASSLTKDPNFTAAVAAAISGRILHNNHIKNC